MSSSPSSHVVPVNRLRRFTEIAFERVGCSASGARNAARVLMWASLRGVDTHGIRNLVPYYLTPIRAGEVQSRPRLETIHETPTTIRLNGGGGLGLVCAGEAMQIAIQKAMDVGVGMATVENSHHLGPAGYFASLGLSEGLLGICATGHFFGDGNPIGVAPLNSARAMLSTNPLSLAAPTGKHPDFVLDMATAAATVNRIEMFGQAGIRLPLGWAKDAAGNATDDPEIACILNALGGQTVEHKGVALSMMVSILTGVLTGGWKEDTEAGETKYKQSTMGHFLAAVRIDQFMPVEQFKNALDSMLDAIVACPRLDKNESIHYPGSREHEMLQARTREGVPLDARLFQELDEVRRLLSIPDSL